MHPKQLFNPNDLIAACVRPGSVIRFKALTMGRLLHREFSDRSAHTFYSYSDGAACVLAVIPFAISQINQFTLLVATSKGLGWLKELTPEVFLNRFETIIL